MNKKAQTKDKNIKMELRVLRKLSGKKINEIAEKIFVHPYTLYKYEKHISEPSVSIALKLAEEYGLKVEDICW